MRSYLALFFSLLLLSPLSLAVQAPAPSVTYDLVRDFNLTNAPTGIFTAGWGNTPGTFVLFQHVFPDCLGYQTICHDNNGSQPYWSGVSYNYSGATVTSLTIVQPTALVRLDPQLTAGTMVRFTAPVAGDYTVTGRFQSIDTNQHSTVVQIFAKAAQQFFDTIPWYSYGTQRPFSIGPLTLAAGETIDFVVKTNSNCCYLSTGLAATVSRTVSANDISSNTRVYGTGFLYNRATNRFITTLSVRNNGTQPIAGPVTVVLSNLPAGIALVNKTGMAGNDPYITLPNSMNIQPGGVATVVLQFTNSAGGFISFTPVVFEGAF